MKACGNTMRILKAISYSVQGASFFIAPAAAANEPQKVIEPQEKSDKAWEIGIFYPLQFYRTQTDLGSSSSFTAVGFGVLANRLIWDRFGIMGSYQVDLNAVTSAAIFSGANFGASAVFLGQESLVQDSPVYSLRRYPFLRGLISAGVGTRSYDFRTLISTKEIELAQAQGKTIELEGSGWAPFLRLQFDARVWMFARVGAFFQLQNVLQNKAHRTRVQSYFIGLTYEFSRLSGAE